MAGLLESHEIRIVDLQTANKEMKKTEPAGQSKASLSSLADIHKIFFFKGYAAATAAAADATAVL